VARCDKTVTAIVAGTGDDRHASALQQSSGHIGHGSPSIFHQIDTRHAPGNRQPVCFRHFCRGEKFEHGSRHYRRCTTRTNQVIWLRGNINGVAGKSFRRVLNCWAVNIILLADQAAKTLYENDFYPLSGLARDLLTGNAALRINAVGWGEGKRQ
jgi:hypothetical protein